MNDKLASMMGNAEPSRPRNAKQCLQALPPSPPFATPAPALETAFVFQMKKIGKTESKARAVFQECAANPVVATAVLKHGGRQEKVVDVVQDCNLLWNRQHVPSDALFEFLVQNAYGFGWGDSALEASLVVGMGSYETRKHESCMYRMGTFLAAFLHKCPSLLDLRCGGDNDSKGLTILHWIRRSGNNTDLETWVLRQPVCAHLQPTDEEKRFVTAMCHFGAKAYEAHEAYEICQGNMVFATAVVRFGADEMHLRAVQSDPSLLWQDEHDLFQYLVSQSRYFGWDRAALEDALARGMQKGARSASKMRSFLETFLPNHPGLLDVRGDSSTGFESSSLNIVHWVMRHGDEPFAEWMLTASNDKRHWLSLQVRANLGDVKDRGKLTIVGKTPISIALKTGKSEFVKKVIRMHPSVLVDCLIHEKHSDMKIWDVFKDGQDLKELRNCVRELNATTSNNNLAPS
jgi:hypothetical protein